MLVQLLKAKERSRTAFNVQNSQQQSSGSVDGQFSTLTTMGSGCASDVAHASPLLTGPGPSTPRHPSQRYSSSCHSALSSTAVPMQSCRYWHTHHASTSCSEIELPLLVDTDVDTPGAIDLGLGNEIALAKHVGGVLDANDETIEDILLPVKPEMRSGLQITPR